jgi:hypothetical protein
MVDMNIPARLEAISGLAKITDARFTLEDGEITRWTKGDKPTEEEIQTKMDSVAYIRNRKAEYPDMGSQLNKIYDDGVTKWKAEMVDPVKAKWPKDNSGPV